MTREQAVEKLKRLKALIDRPGTEGEREAAQALYDSLLEKYQIEEKQVAPEIKKRWFRFKTKLERKLLIQIFYAVTGDATFWEKVDHRRHDLGVDCTEAEKIEIEFLYNFYREALNKDLETFISAFISANDIYPDESARCYQKPNTRFFMSEREMQIAQMASGINKSVPPRALLED